MASIFDGVPFIAGIPGRREPLNHAANLAVGAHIADTINRTRIANREQDRKDKQMEMMGGLGSLGSLGGLLSGGGGGSKGGGGGMASMVTSLLGAAMANRRDAQGKLVEARLQSAVNESSDMGLMNEWLPKLYENPDIETPPFKTLNSLEQWEKSRALIEQRRLGLSRVQIAQGIEKEIHTLPDRGEAARLLGLMFREGISDNLISQLRGSQQSMGLVEGLTPGANTAIFAEKMRMQSEQLREAGDAEAADRLSNTAMKIDATLQHGDTGARARLDMAKTEFEAATKELSPDTPEWITARNKYMREVDTISGPSAQSGAASYLESLGVTQDSLKQAVERWKANQGTGPIK